jgi:hypothetical protein
MIVPNNNLAKVVFAQFDRLKTLADQTERSGVVQRIIESRNSMFVLLAAVLRISDHPSLRKMTVCAHAIIFELEAFIAY